MANLDKTVWTLLMTSGRSEEARQMYQPSPPLNSKFTSGEAAGKTIPPYLRRSCRGYDDDEK